MSEAMTGRSAPSPTRWMFGAVVLLACVVSATLRFRDPDGLGVVVDTAVSAALMLVIAVAPVVRGARPRRVWRVEQAAVLFLLPTLFGDHVPLALGPVSFSDLVSFLGYLCLIAWLVLAARCVGGRPTSTTALDTAAQTTGTVLATWTVLSPLFGGEQLPGLVVAATYPVADVLLLGLVVQLGMRQGRPLWAMSWLFASLLLLLTLDATRSLIGAFVDPRPSPGLAGLYVFVFAGLAMAVSSPSVVKVTQRAPSGPVHLRGSRRTALIVLTISPAIVATFLPLNGALDGVVRGVLVALILALLFVRLSRTMTALSLAEAQSHHRASHDPLTGLVNRGAFADRLGVRLEEDRRAGRSTAVLFLDCDEFKYVNDTWGHHAGDTVLCDIADRLPDHLGAGTEVARFGGDEFVVMRSVDDLAGGEALAAEVRGFFDRPVRVLPDRVHAMTCSIGLAVVDAAEGLRADELIGRADVAMYAAKGQRARGRGAYVVFDEGLALAFGRRASVGDRLGAAIREGRFDVRLHPIVGRPPVAGRDDGPTGYTEVVGWEALAHWDDPVLGAVPPETFVPLAEHLGLIGDLGELLLRRSCAELARLRLTSPDADPWMSVAISPAHLLHPGFADVVGRVAAQAGVPADRLLLAVTETLLVDEGPDVLAALAELRGIGVRIGIDDFGTGYAALANLLRVPPDCVKLDRSLLAQLGPDPATHRQLAAVLALVRSLGIEQIVAEGVETADQADALALLGCPMVQGPWFERRTDAGPAPAALAADTAASEEMDTIAR